MFIVNIWPSRPRALPLATLVLVIAALPIIAGYSAMPSKAQQTALAFEVYASPAPNRHGAGVSLTAYETWVSRALDSVENNRGNIGNPANDPGAFTIIRNAKPREFIVTANPSWRGVAEPQGAFANQQGNRLHFVLRVRGNGAVRFKFEDLSWDWWSNGGWFTAKRSMASSPPTGYSAAFNRVDCTYGYGYDWGADRVKGGADDVKVCNSDTTLVDELIYVGAGLGMAADTRYNRPVDYPDVAHLTVQDWLYTFCDYFNSEADTREVGMLFRIVGSDNVTYQHTARLKNPEFGKALNPSTCRPFPVIKSQSDQVQLPATTQEPPVYTGEEIIWDGYQVWALHGLRSGIQFQRRDASAIGNQAVLAAGFIDAVDVWGFAEQSWEVCFPAQGSVIFLDASTSPRGLSYPSAYSKNGMTCAANDRPGTVVLLPGPVPISSWRLSDCMVTTKYMLNFRDGPGGEKFGDFIPYDVTLTALERTSAWFKVDYHGAIGWVSARHVSPHGACG